jgi:hypothetical protein
VDNPFILPLQREHDFYLMDVVLASKQFTTEEVRKINYCRLYLQAVTVSDISLAGGTRLDPYFLKGTRGPMSSERKCHHVNQSRPYDKSWNIWQKANYLWTRQGTKLYQPLGRWLVPTKQLRRDWQAYLDPRAHELLIRQTNTQYTIHPQQEHGYLLEADGHTNKLPSYCRPASILKGTTAWAARNTKPCVPIFAHVTPIAGTFTAFLADLPDWEQMLLLHIEYHMDLYSIHHSLTSCTISMGVSDGSVVKDRGLRMVP